MKKTLAVIFTLLLGVVLVSCKKDPKPPVGLSDKDYVSQAISSLSIGNEEALAAVASDITLPQTFGSDEALVNISWEVTKGQAALEVLGEVLKVTRPEANEADVQGEVKATLTKGEYSDSKTIALTVIKKTAEVSYASFKEMAQAIEFSDIVAAGSAGIEVMFDSLTVTGHQTDGYFVSDGVTGMYVHGGTKPAVGTTGKFTTKVTHYFNGYQLLGKNSNFEGTTTIKTEQEIKAMANELSVQTFLDTMVKNSEGKYLGLSGAALNDAKQDLDVMTFFKAEVYVKTVADIEYDGHKVVFYDTEAQIGSEDFIQNYYKSTLQGQLTTLGNEAEPVKLTIYANVQEIRDNLGDASYTGEARDIYRVTTLYIDVELSDDAKSALDADEAAASVRPVQYEAYTITLPAAGTNGSAITYELVNPEHSSILNLATGEITPAADLTEVKVKVTATLNDAVNEAEMVLYVGLPIATTSISSLNDDLLGKIVRIEGVVSGNSYDAGFKNGEATLTDSEGNTLLVFRYPSKYENVFKDGDTLSVVGVLGKYNGKFQIVAPFGEAVKK